ncbi:hypothetical protein [Altererythrobacter aquiaggeris]|uniref:hypothetical protein n=1 Tax=Aestuarierythrobacter aquiaggeris TaxID=1898396 RepID=UPI003015A7C0
MERAGDSKSVGHGVNDGDAAAVLTEKQREVMIRIDRRMPIKVIAGEMGVSETRINQHIRALKDIFGAGSLNELVELHRTRAAAQDLPDDDPYSFSQYTNNQVPGSGAEPQTVDRVATHKYPSAPAAAPPKAAAGQMGKEPRVVPEALDGENAVLYRLAIIIGLAVGIVAAIVLVLTAALGVGEVLDDKASVPAITKRPAG